MQSYSTWQRRGWIKSEFDWKFGVRAIPFCPAHSLRRLPHTRHGKNSFGFELSIHLFTTFFETNKQTHWLWIHSNPGVETFGAKILIAGRSRHVGLPLALFWHLALNFRAEFTRFAVYSSVIQPVTPAESEFQVATFPVRSTHMSVESISPLDLLKTHDELPTSLSAAPWAS